MTNRCRVSIVLLGLLGLVSSSGCVIAENGTVRERTDVIGGRRVDVGYFEPGGNGDYVLLARAGSTWQIKELTGAPLPVTAGEELLYLQAGKDGVLEVTPVWGDATWLSAEKSMLVCDPEKRAYSACNSAFAKTVPLLAEKRKLDREAIALAVKQSGVLERLDQRAKRASDHLDQRAIEDEARARVQRRKASIRGSVVRVENAPGLIAIAPDDAKELLTLDSTNLDDAGESFRVSARFSRLSRRAPQATVDCFLLASAPEYRVDHVQESPPSTLEVVARVDYCDIDAPRPSSFKAADKGAPLTVTLTQFDPRGHTVLTLSNPSGDYVTATSISVYYFSKIYTQEKALDLPPAAEQVVVLATDFDPSISRIPRVTAADLDQKTFTFGVAVKYTAGAGPKTLFSLRQIPLKAVLAPLK